LLKVLAAGFLMGAGCGADDLAVLAALTDALVGNGRRLRAGWRSGSVVAAGDVAGAALAG
jgi:hypothetical protein